MDATIEYLGIPVKKKHRKAVDILDVTTQRGIFLMSIGDAQAQATHLRFQARSTAPPNIQKAMTVEHMTGSCTSFFGSDTGFGICMEIVVKP